MLMAMESLISSIRNLTHLPALLLTAMVLAAILTAMVFLITKTKNWLHLHNVNLLTLMVLVNVLRLHVAILSQK
jgi:hypothetical protein